MIPVNIENVCIQDEAKAKSHYYDSQNPAGVTGNKKKSRPLGQKKGGVKTAQKMQKIGRFMYSKKRNRQMSNNTKIESTNRVKQAPGLMLKHTPLFVKHTLESNPQHTLNLINTKI